MHNMVTTTDRFVHPDIVLNAPDLSSSDSLLYTLSSKVYIVYVDDSTFQFTIIYELVTLYLCINLFLHIVHPTQSRQHIEVCAHILSQYQYQYVAILLFGV